jgi:hypothetical protein
MCLKIGHIDVDRIHLTEIASSFEPGSELLGSTKVGDCVAELSDYKLL